MHASMHILNHALRRPGVLTRNRNALVRLVRCLQSPRPIIEHVYAAVHNIIYESTAIYVTFHYAPRV